MDMETIDLRSDTVTLPTSEMRAAMLEAPLGDDVFGEDPTTRRLEVLTAERMGKEDALLVCSGTMANLVSVLTHCGRGEEVILGDQCHTFRYEAGGIAAFGGVHSYQLENQPDGTIDIDRMAAAIRADDVHFPRTRLICLENTHNRCRGAVLTPEYTSAVSSLAGEHGLALHVDGARVFNAAIALGCDVADLARHAHSITLCLSKGLAAPVGSLICGAREFITRARRIRKAVGGGMRQSGVIAAAGLVALERMVERLADDHVNARRLAEGISRIPGLSIDLERVVTNLVYFDLTTDRMSAEQFVGRLEEKGIKCLTLDVGGLRMVTHHGILPADVERTLEIMSWVIANA